MGVRLYGILGVAPGASDNEIRSAYLRRALATHPDKGGSAAAFREVVEAFETLGDATRRAFYDVQADPAGRGADEGIVPRRRTPSSRGEHSGASKRPATGPPGQPAAQKRERPQWGPGKPRGSNTQAGPGRCEGLGADEADYSAQGRAANANRSSELIEELLAQPSKSWQSSLEGVPEATLREVLEQLGGEDPRHAPRQKDADAAVDGPGESAADDEECDKALLALCCDLAEDDEGSMPTAADSHRQRTEVSRGIIRRTKGLATWSYQATVGFQSMIITSRSTGNLDEAIGMHISLVHLRQVARAKLKEGCDFASALHQAVAQIKEERALSKALDMRAGFYTVSSVVESGKRRNVYSPLTRDVTLAGSFWMAMKALGTSMGVADWQCCKDEMLPRVAVERRAEALQNDTRRRKLQLKAQIRSALRRLDQARRKLLHKRWKVSELPHGLEFGSLKSSGDCVCAVLWTSDGAKVCGPLRRRIIDARADLEELSAIQHLRGDEALHEEVSRRDVEAMTAYFTEQLAQVGS